MPRKNNAADNAHALSAAQIEQFIHDGYVKIEDAFPRTAQPPLLPSAPFSLTRSDNACSPVEQAIRLALND